VGCTGWWAQRQGSGRSFLVAFCQPISMTAQFMGQFHSSDFRRCECKANLQTSAPPGSFRKRSKQWPVPGRETEKLAYVRAGNFGRFLRLWAIIDVSESGVVRLNGPKTSPERTHPQPLSHSNGRSLFFSQSSNQNAPISGEIWSKSGQIARNAQRSAGLSHLWVQMLGGSLLDPPPISGAAGNFTK
jgi:hypothetical protein